MDHGLWTNDYRLKKLWNVGQQQPGIPAACLLILPNSHHGWVLPFAVAPEHQLGLVLQGNVAGGAQGNQVHILFHLVAVAFPGLPGGIGKG